MGADASEVKLLVGPERRVRALADVVCASIGELYKVGAELGVGRFSTVHAGEALGTGRRFALKVVENGSLNEDENLVALETEVQILRLLEHPYVVSLKEVVMTIDKTYIVMELLNGGELFEKIAEVGCYPEREAALVFARLIAAVEFMHARQVVHRDLKPENILFVQRAEERVPTDIKVIDFGYAGIWTPGAELTGLCGTPDYVAPEILSWYDGDAGAGAGAEGGDAGAGAAGSPSGAGAGGGALGVRYGKVSDVWSLGVLLYVLLSGTSPFAAEDEPGLLRRVLAADYAFPDREWRAVSAEAKSLIQAALVADPDARASLAELKAHPWCASAVAQVAAELKSQLGAAGGRQRGEADSHCRPSCLLQ